MDGRRAHLWGSRGSGQGHRSPTPSRSTYRGQPEVTRAQAASVPSSGRGQVVRGRPGARDQLLSGLMGLGAWGATERAGGASDMPGKGQARPSQAGPGWEVDPGCGGQCGPCSLPSRLLYQPAALPLPRASRDSLRGAVPPSSAGKLVHSSACLWVSARRRDGSRPPAQPAPSTQPSEDPHLPVPPSVLAWGPLT